MGFLKLNINSKLCEIYNLDFDKRTSIHVHLHKFTPQASCCLYSKNLKKGERKPTSICRIYDCQRRYGYGLIYVVGPSPNSICFQVAKLY